MSFDYENAFSRNLGWLSREEQVKISKVRIGIPGMGGVGGHHVHTLARLGFSHFKLADFDQFDEHNFNRQIGASISTIGQSKVEVMKNLLLDINPDSTVEIFSEGVNESNYDSFLKDLDILIDGLDIYVIKPRIALFDRAHKLGIPVLTAGPFGMGTSFMCFSPNSVSFSDYFNINNQMDSQELLIRFMAGISPTPIHTKYMFYEDEIDFKTGKVPSLHVGALAATTIIGSNVLKLVLKRGNLKFAPFSYHYDFYLNKLKVNWRPWGNRNYLQRFLISRIRKKVLELSSD